MNYKIERDFGLVNDEFTTGNAERESLQNFYDK